MDISEAEEQPEMDVAAVERGVESGSDAPSVLGAGGNVPPAKKKRTRRKALPPFDTLNSSSQRRVEKKLGLVDKLVNTAVMSFTEEGREVNPKAIVRALQLATGQVANAVHHTRGAVAATLGAAEHHENASEEAAKKVNPRRKIACAPTHPHEISDFVTLCLSQTPRRHFRRPLLSS
jgi:hypothetical protein